jgi:threonine dehydrogenase-like Zn-dependent dehydrogenase
VRALVWHGAQRLDYEDASDPAPKDDEVVLTVELAGICGSDVHGYRGHPGPRVPPLVLGHEAVGTIGAERYVVYPLRGCGDCERCRAGQDNLCPGWQLLGMHSAGVFSDAVAVPRRSLVPVHTGLDSRRAVLTEPLACCVGAIGSHNIGSSTRVVVLGCGPIGLLTVYLTASAGAEVIAVDPLSERLAHAERLGAAACKRDFAELRPGWADLAIDAAGFESTWRAGVEAVAPGGTVVVLGLGQAEGAIPMAVIVRRAVVLRGQFAYTRAEFARALAILEQGDLDVGWAAEMPLEDGARAFAQLVDDPAHHVKLLLRP